MPELPAIKIPQMQLEKYFYEFCERFSIKSDSLGLEYFITYQIAQKKDSVFFEEMPEEDIKEFLEEVNTQNMQGIDAILLFRNDRIVRMNLEVEKEIEKRSWRGDAIDIVFIEVKSGNVDSKEMLAFTNAISSLFDNNKIIEDKLCIKFLRLVIKNADKIKSSSIKKIFCATGIDSIQKKSHNDNIKKLNLDSTNFKIENNFSNINSNPTKIYDLILLDKQDIKDIVSKNDNEYMDAELDVSDFILFDKTNKDVKSFSLYMSAKNFVEQILQINNTTETDIQQKIFDRNIRGWQGNNKRFNKIGDTLNNPKKRKLFHVLNNGVTIVCQEFSSNPNKTTMRDYHIVNGRQTSEALKMQYQKNSELLNDVYILLKIISTDDKSLSTDITISANTQQSVSDTQLYALRPFVLLLEKEFDKYSDKSIKFIRLSDKSIKKITGQYQISIQEMAQSILSTIYKLPHDAVASTKYHLDKIYKKDVSDIKDSSEEIGQESINENPSNEQINSEIYLLYFNFAKLFIDLRKFLLSDKAITKRIRHHYLYILYLMFLKKYGLIDQLDNIKNIILGYSNAESLEEEQYKLIKKLNVKMAIFYKDKEYNNMQKKAIILGVESWKGYKKKNKTAIDTDIFKKQDYTDICKSKGLSV